MKNKLSNIKGIQILSKESQKEITGKAGGKCGCDCTGAVTGPAYCQWFWACPQVITC